MQKKTCYLVSLKYAPGLWKEFSLIGTALREQGFCVKYLISSAYGWMINQKDGDVLYVSTSKNIKEMIFDLLKYPFGIWHHCAAAFRKEPPSFICIYNPHPLNAVVLRHAKYFSPKGIRAIYMHEPARPGKEAYGLKGRVFFNIVDFTQSIALSNTTDVVLPSPVANDLFKQTFPTYDGGTHYAPILIPDKPYGKSKQRRCFSMVGRFNFAKRLDLFIDVINYAVEHNEDYEFQIITSSPIQEFVNRLTKEGKSKVIITQKKNISDEEISECVAASYAVLCLQPMITQSGVVPVAFMNSTPVIVSNIPGFTQFVKHGGNGWVLPEQFTVQDIFRAMKSVRDNFDDLSINARNTFNQVFAAKNWSSYYAWLIDALNKNDV